MALMLFCLAYGPVARGDREVAVPLLAAPINATWAANHGEDWHERGIRGFLFQGLLDDLRLLPSEADRPEFSVAAAGAGEEATTPTLGAHPQYPGAMVVSGDWDALKQETRGAINRLNAQGISHNFLHITLAPEAPYLVNAALADIAVQRFHQAGMLCAATGLRGIAVETQSHSGIFDYRWAGYPPGTAADALADDARRFALRLMRAYIRAHPEGTLLLLAGSPETAGPLWFPFIEGALESVGAADAIPIRLAFLDEADRLDPRYYESRPRQVSRWFRQRVSTAAYERWTRQGGLVFGLEPIHYRQDIPAARYPLDAYRRALHAAALYGTEYVLLQAPDGGWWHIPPDVAEQFAHLRQAGRARVRYAPPVPRALDAFMPRLLFPDAGYIGPLDVAGNRAEVLHNDRGATLVFWDGIPDDLELRARQQIIAVTPLCQGEKHFLTPREGRLTLPAQAEAFLVEGLSPREFALPAALWLDASEPIAAGITRQEVRFGIANPLTVPLRGTLTLVADPQYGLGAAAFPVNLAPGESATFQRKVQGISFLGPRARFRLTLAMASGAPVQREFSLPVEPPVQSRLVLDAPPTGAALLLRPPRERSHPLLFLLDARGGLWCRDTESEHLLWRQQSRGAFRLPPVLLADERGESRVAVVNEYGRARLFDAAGVERAQLFLDLPEPAGIAALRLPDSPAAVMVLGAQSGVLVCHEASGRRQWRIDAPMKLGWLVSDTALPGILVVAGNVAAPEAESPDTGRLSAYDHLGNVLWTTELEHPVSCEPALHGSAEHAQPVVCTADASGAVRCFNTITGTPMAAIHTGESTPITALAAFEPGQSDNILSVYATETRVAAAPVRPSDADGHPAIPLWAKAIRATTTLTPLPNGAGIAVGAADGAVYALDPNGNIRWESHTGAGAVKSLLFVQDHRQRNAYFCVVASADHLLRILHIREDRIAPAPDNKPAR